MSEAQLAIEENLKRKRAEEKQAWDEYLQLRAKQRAKEEDDLKKLKERQARRKAQRAEDEKFMLEMRRKQEEQHRQELEERKRKEADAKRQRLEEAEKKRLAMQQAIRQRDEAARRNFIVNKTTSGPADGGPVVFGVQDVMKTKEQLAEDKKIALSIRIKPLKIDNLHGAELKKMVNELWDTIIQLESDKYDLEEEQKRQEYHLKELTERQKQFNKNKALKLGLDMEDLSGKHPPKVRLASKYERRIDRRTFNEKTNLFAGAYVEMQKKQWDKEWEHKINQFKDQHGDKHVPKWDPSAPRKDVAEPGARNYEDESEDEEHDLLAGKLRGFMEQSEQNENGVSRGSASNSVSESRRSSTAQQQIQDQRRRSSAANSISSSRRVSAAAPPPTKAPSPPPAEEEEEEDEEEYEDEEEEEEEYDEEEEDE